MRPRQWYKDVTNSKLKMTTDLLNTYANCRSIGSYRYIFNIKGNNYRLVVRISFELQTIWIRFVGTHGEYDIIDPLTI